MIWMPTFPLWCKLCVSDGLKPVRFNMSEAALSRTASLDALSNSFIVRRAGPTKSPKYNRSSRKRIWSKSSWCFHFEMVASVMPISLAISFCVIFVRTISRIALTMFSVAKYSHLQNCHLLCSSRGVFYDFFLTEYIRPEYLILESFLVSENHSCHLSLLVCIL